MAQKILAATGRRVRDAFSDTDKQGALHRCLEAGVAALVASASTDAPEETDLLASIFERFSEDPDVGKELEALLRGNLPNTDELRYLFQEAGYDPDSLPGLDFERGMALFGATFLSAATGEHALQGIIQTGQLLAQTKLLRDLVETTRDLVEIVQNAKPESLGIRAGEVVATVKGKQVVYLLPQREGQPGGTEGESLRASYLNRLFETTARLSLAGIDPKAASDKEEYLHLDAVYTVLLTLTPQEHDRMQRGEVPDREDRRLSALAQLDRHPRMVLMGDPGSGKSTFVNFVAMCLAGEGMGRRTANLALLTAPLPDEEGEDQEEPQPWGHGALLPVRVVLRDFAARGLPPPGQRATAENLWHFIVEELESAAIGDYALHLRGELLEQGGLIFLDGLDEVPEADRRREQIKQAVEEFVAIFPRCRVLVTSRTYAYQQQAWRLPDFAEAVLAPFTGGQIRRFVDRWYAHIAELRGWHHEDSQGRAELLKRAIFGSDRLHALAERPLLLTLMASLHAWRGGSLPEKREVLYADTVNLLLDWWESPKIVRDAQGEMTVLQPSMAEWLKVDKEKVLDLLNELAFQAHAAQPDLAGTADIPEGELVTGLMRLSQNPEAKPARLVEFLSQRAGLLLPRGVEVYTFPHRTFQEYLAACYLTDHEYPEKVTELARTQPERWREATLLAGAKAARGTASAIWSLVDALCYREPDDGESSLEDVWGAHLAGLSLVESADLERVSERNKPKVERVRRWLVRILERGQLPAVERAATGDSLARLGDPRFRSDAWYLPEETLLGFVEIPAGSFIMGSDEKQDRFAMDRELPQHHVKLDTYYIARYLVTVAQFRAFVEDTGYEPRDPDCLKGFENHPVVWVTWYDATAYCGWLTERLRARENTPDPVATLLKQGKEGGSPWRITLPSEAEWEKAARGADGLIYPWGDESDSNRANYAETGVGSTSAVGCFANGASPYGCLDMAGNVWEWTRSLWGKKFEEPDFRYPYKSDDGREDTEAGREVLRVLGGGSFDDYEDVVRCAYRVRFDPVYGVRYVGFRVVLSPS